MQVTDIYIPRDSSDSYNGSVVTPNNKKTINFTFWNNELSYFTVVADNVTYDRTASNVWKAFKCQPLTEFDGVNLLALEQQLIIEVPKKY